MAKPHTKPRPKTTPAPPPEAGDHYCWHCHNVPHWLYVTTAGLTCVSCYIALTGKHPPPGYPTHERGVSP